MEVIDSSFSQLRVAIIGRPNVGKSTLFNTLTRSRKALVKNEPGVTRDVQMDQVEWWGRTFEILDTGGITDEKTGFSPLIKEQVLDLLERVSLLLLVFDGRTGLVPEDRDVVKLAIQSGKPYLMIVNKVDSQQETEMRCAEFYEFGEDLIPASFEKRDNVDRIVEWILSFDTSNSKDSREGVRIALVGKPNVGKSSLSNRLLGHKRMLVSDIAGTTVDSIEDQFEYNDKPYILVDTAGLRKSSKRKDGVEFISAVKSQDSIRKADIVLLLVDGREGPTDQDAKVLEYALKAHKGVILVANKSDLGEDEIDEYRKTFREKVGREFHFFNDIPIEFVSAKTGSGIKKLFARVESVWEKLNIHITTSQLNNFFFEAIRQAPAPVWGTQNVKFYYLVKTKQVPPSFIAFANHPLGVTPAYRRFLAKKIQERWGLEGIPIRIFVMQSKRKKSTSRSTSNEAPIEEVSLDNDFQLNDFEPDQNYYDELTSLDEHLSDDNIKMFELDGN